MSMQHPTILDLLTRTEQQFRSHCSFLEGRRALNAVQTLQVSQGVPVRREQRREERLTVALPATAASGDKIYGVLVMNLAHGGAMIDASAALPVRSRITFQCGSIMRKATVAWQSGRQIGIRFDRPLAGPEVAEQVSRSSALAARRRAKALNS